LTEGAPGGDAGEPATSPWHEGELAIQRHAGVAIAMDAVGRRNVRRWMPEQHRAFFRQLPFAVVATVDPAGDAWATIIAGEPGFLTSGDPRELRVVARRDRSDPADAGLVHGAAIGLLGIDPTSRRRNRLNGILDRSDEEGFDISVVQSFGNCPQYIRKRDILAIDERDRAPPPRELDFLDEGCLALIERADTCFIASYVDLGEGRQVDVSHRGGRSGFVRAERDGTLTLPDFAGNQFFNTLGNVLANPRCGYSFFDFTTGDILQLSGDGEVDLDSPEIAAFLGAERLMRFKARRIILRRAALPFRMAPQADADTPDLAMTGTWKDAEERLAAAGAKAWRSLRVVETVQETARIRSLYLVPEEGSTVPPHRAGQHLTMRATPAGSSVAIVRSYTLSSAPSDRSYRISVKLAGRMSGHIHRLEVGDVVEALGPAGLFTIDPQALRPAVLVAAGIGITPILAMLRHLVQEGRRAPPMRPTVLFYGARSRMERAFDAEIAELQSASRGALRIVRALSDVTDAGPRDYEARRLVAGTLLAYPGCGDGDFYICGPRGFMQAIYDGLHDAHIVDDRIHAEAFGTASLTRRPRSEGAGEPVRDPASGPVDVIFERSGTRAVWSPGSGSILELAETEGLTPASGCRLGACGGCRATILDGAVVYAAIPPGIVPGREALICCCMPAEGEGLLRFDL
jgi:ferredoxin-NADP reductase/predicted pyridoxine 5'-phosphate oxidase superfamily flavin-nucleotide-binding protein